MYMNSLSFILLIAFCSVVYSQDWVWQHPALGEIWTSGTTVSIQWQSLTQTGCVQSAIGFSLVRASDAHIVITDITKPIATSQSPPDVLGTNSYSWAIPLNTVAPAQYYLVQQNCGGYWSNRSSVFTICAGVGSPWGAGCPSSTSTIAPLDWQWLHPVASDIWTTGTQVTLQWLTWTETCIQTGVGISLYRAFDGVKVINDITSTSAVSPQPPNNVGSNQYIWTIPTDTIAPALYYLIQENCGAYFTAKSSPFTICAGSGSPFGTGCPTSTTNQSINWEWIHPGIGEKWNTGSTVQLQWLTFDQTCIQGGVGFSLIRSIDGKTVIKDITTPLAVDQQPPNNLGLNSFNWTIPNDGTIAPDIYMLSQLNCGYYFTLNSGGFTICTQNNSPFGSGCESNYNHSTPAEWVWLHPVSSDVWQAGETVELEWLTYTQTCVQGGVGLALYDFYTNEKIISDITIANASTSQPANNLGLNKFTWTISGVSSGWYYLQQINCGYWYVNSSSTFQICNGTCPPMLQTSTSTSSSIYPTQSDSYGDSNGYGPYWSEALSKHRVNVIQLWGILFGLILLIL